MLLLTLIDVFVPKYTLRASILNLEILSLSCWRYLHWQNLLRKPWTKTGPQLSFHLPRVVRAELNMHQLKLSLIPPAFPHIVNNTAGQDLKFQLWLRKRKHVMMRSSLKKLRCFAIINIYFFQLHAGGSGSGSILYCSLEKCFKSF